MYASYRMRCREGRTPVVIGKKEGAYAATSESSSFPNLDYEIDRYLGPGEIVRLYNDHVVQLRKPGEGMQICSFLWVYYGFPTSCYEGKNVEEVRFTSVTFLPCSVSGNRSLFMILKSMIVCSPLRRSFRNSIKMSLSISLPNMCLKPKSVKGLINFPIVFIGFSD